MPRFAVGIFISEKRASFFNCPPKSRKLAPQLPSPGSHVWAKWTADNKWYMFHLARFSLSQKEANELCEELATGLLNSDDTDATPCCHVCNVTPALCLPPVLPQIDGQTELGPDLFFPNSAPSAPSPSPPIKKPKNPKIKNGRVVKKKFVRKPKPAVVAAASKLLAAAKLKQQPNASTNSQPTDQSSQQMLTDIYSILLDVQQRQLDMEKQQTAMEATIEQVGTRVTKIETDICKWSGTISQLGTRLQKGSAKRRSTGVSNISDTVTPASMTQLPVSPARRPFAPTQTPAMPVAKSARPSQQRLSFSPTASSSAAADTLLPPQNQPLLSVQDSSAADNVGADLTELTPSVFGQAIAYSVGTCLCGSSLCQNQNCQAPGQNNTAPIDPIGIVEPDSATVTQTNQLSTPYQQPEVAILPQSGEQGGAAGQQLDVALYRFFVKQPGFQIVGVRCPTKHSRTASVKRKKVDEDSKNMAQMKNLGVGIKIPQKIYDSAALSQKPQHFFQKVADYAFSPIEIATQRPRGGKQTSSSHNYEQLPIDRLRALYEHTEKLFPTQFCAATALISDPNKQFHALLGQTTSEAVTALGKKLTDQKLQLVSDSEVREKARQEFGLPPNCTVFPFRTVSTAQPNVFEVVGLQQ